MTRPLSLATLAFLAVIVPVHPQESKPGRPTAADKVKATATATWPDADGKQTVTITLDIEKPIILGANPVNHNNEFLDVTKLVVKIAAKEKVTLEVRYPPGTTRRDGNERYDIYEGVVKINAEIVRTKGDTSPLEVSIRVHGWGLGY